VFYEAIAVGDHSVLCHFEDAVSRQEFIQEDLRFDQSLQD
jgi:hypothetical protein